MRLGLPASSAGLDLFDAARLAPGQVDAELLRSAEDVLVGVAHLDATMPSLESTSTFRHSDCISLISTLKDSGMPGSGMFSPLTMAS